MDLIEYFERQKKRSERELKYAEAAGFQLCERKPRKASRTSPRSISGNCANRAKSIGA